MYKSKILVSNKRKKTLSKKRKNRKQSTKKTRSHMSKMRGGAKFIFIDLQDYKSDEEKKAKIKEIKDLLIKNKNKITNTNNINIFLTIKDLFTNHILYYFDDEDNFIGKITGNIDEDIDTYNKNATNNKSVRIDTIDLIMIRNIHKKKGYGKILLTEYINQVLEKYKNINTFKLVNAGGKVSFCFYYNTFKSMGYNIDKYTDLYNLANCKNKENNNKIKKLNFYV